MTQKKGVPLELRDAKGRDILDRERLWKKSEEESGHRRYRNRNREARRNRKPKQ